MTYARIGDHVVENGVVHMVEATDVIDGAFYMLSCDGRFSYGRDAQIVERTRPVTCLRCLRWGLIG